jgi:hypothetical protein
MDMEGQAQESKGSAVLPQAPGACEGVAVRPVEAKLETERPLPTKRVSLKMSNVDVSVLLRAGPGRDVNIILNDRVTGRSNINITQAPGTRFSLGSAHPQPDLRLAGDIIRIMTADDLEELQEAGARICSWPKRRLPALYRSSSPRPTSFRRT